jgi:uncharacterized protein (DUF2267 family)
VKDREFFHNVADRSGLSRQEAADVSRASLQTLGERLSGGEARDLAAELPEPLAQPLRSGDEAAQNFDLEEFVRRVSEHTGLTPTESVRGIRAVLMTLRDAAVSEEYAEAMSQLPKEFTTLVATAG